MRQEYYLQTDTQQQAIEALHSIGLADIEGNAIYCDINYLGPVFLSDGRVDTRFHTNLLCPAPLTDEKIAKLPLIYPKNPVCVWA